MKPCPSPLDKNFKKQVKEASDLLDEVTNGQPASLTSKYSEAVLRKDAAATSPFKIGKDSIQNNRVNTYPGEHHSPGSLKEQTRAVGENSLLLTDSAQSQDIIINDFVKKNMPNNREFYSWNGRKNKDGKDLGPFAVEVIRKLAQECYNEGEEKARLAQELKDKKDEVHRWMKYANDAGLVYMSGIGEYDTTDKRIDKIVRALQQDIRRLEASE